MRQKGISALLCAAALLAAPVWLASQDNYKALARPDHFYYGTISYVESQNDGKDPVVLREGRPTPEPAVLNLPLGPGDIVRTTPDRRCEIQFDTATIVRLDIDTELRIETILARSLSSLHEISNLVLTRGRIYVMYKEYNSREMFQIRTPSSAVKLKHRTVAMMKAALDGTTDVQVKSGKAQILFGSDLPVARELEVGKMERLIVLDNGQYQMGGYITETDFEVWNDEINRNFEDYHGGATVLPKPVRKLPKAVVYFAQKYGNLYGEWLWDDFCGYVWRPFLNNASYPWGWQPYVYGRWSVYGGQMFWVPEEPWGWVPYHLGIWHWDKKLGWVWLPGSFFAPAWADWDFFMGYFGWRPWTLWDWFLESDFAYGYGFEYWNGDWHYGWPGTLPSEPPLQRVSKNQLKKPAQATLPIPPELKSAYKKIVAAYERGDEGARESMRRVPSQLVFVPRGDIDASKIQDKVLRWEDVPRVKGIPPVKESLDAPTIRVAPVQQAFRALRGDEKVRDMTMRDEIPDAGKSEVSANPVPVPVPPPVPIRGPGKNADPAAEGGQDGPRTRSTPRFLDWNPDVKVAARLGVSIEYSSRSNEVRCPELRITSMSRVDRTAPALGSRARPSEDYSVSMHEVDLSSGTEGAAAKAASADRGSGGEKAREESSKGGGKETIKK